MFLTLLPWEQLWIRKSVKGGQVFIINIAKYFSESCEQRRITFHINITINLKQRIPLVSEVKTSDIQQTKHYTESN